MGDEIYDKPRDLSFKVLFVGNSGVGKTAIIKRYLDDEFTERYTPTVQSDCRTKNIDIGYSRKVTLAIWDMGGQETPSTTAKKLYRGCDAVLFVYDITNKESFQELKDWMKEVRVESSETKRVCKMMAHAAKAGVQVQEVSAESGNGVQELFGDIVTDLMDNLAYNELAGQMDAKPARRASWCSVL